MSTCNDSLNYRWFEGNNLFNDGFTYVPIYAITIIELLNAKRYSILHTTHDHFLTKQQIINLVFEMILTRPTEVVNFLLTVIKITPSKGRDY